MKQNIKKIIYSLHPLERKTLPLLLKNKPDQIPQKLNLNEEEINKAILLLEQKGYLKCQRKEETLITLDKFGEKYLKTNLPEILLLKEIENKEKKRSELKIDDETFASALGTLKRNNLIEIKKEKELILKAKKEAKTYLKQNQENPLKQFEKETPKNKLTQKQKQILENFKFRKGFLKETTKKTLTTTLTKQGEQIAKEIQKNYPNIELIEAINNEMLKSGSWKGKQFRHYDTSIKVPYHDIARRHPMMEANKILKSIFIEMGFQEMTGPIIENAFWNMDVMWIPQDHPARDEQDTFYLKGTSKIDKKIASEVKKMHEQGIKRTHTNKDDWSEDIAKKRLLRTHSTSTTFRKLAELAKKHKGQIPDGKYFYIANVFRNEAIDATHLAEFHQAEGFIIADNLSLADLMGFVKEYYAKLGITKIKFKPTYNPYTEPSMEAHYYDEKMKKWYALINSGIFRPETLKPFGINKTIIAWGMGATRVAALLSDKQSMREITGATCDFEWLKNRPIMKREITQK